MKAPDSQKKATARKKARGAAKEKDVQQQSDVQPSLEEENEGGNQFGGMQTGNFKKNMGCGG